MGIDYTACSRASEHTTNRTEHRQSERRWATKPKSCTVLPRLPSAPQRSMARPSCQGTEDSSPGRLPVSSATSTRPQTAALPSKISSLKLTPSSELREPDETLELQEALEPRLGASQSPPNTCLATKATCLK